ncbi:MAG: tetratricopeptide repeat protein [Candidatus Hermodarchaeota archaeon]
MEKNLKIIEKKDSNTSDVSPMDPSVEKKVIKLKKVDIVSNSDINSKEKLQRTSKKLELLKTELRRKVIPKLHEDLAEGLVINLDRLNFAINQVEKVFGETVWIDEIDKNIEKVFKLDTLQKKVKGLDQKINQVKEEALELEGEKILSLEERKLEEEGIKSVLTLVKDVGISAREQKLFDQAIEILQDIDNKLLPAIEIHLPEEDKKDIRATLLKEIKNTFMKKGEIDEAIKVIDSCCKHPDYESKDYIESQIDKSFLFVQKAEFNKAVNILKKALKYEKQLPIKERKLAQSAEIKRALAVAFRGQGAYQKALKWFEESKKEFREAQDEFGYHTALWGMGILRHLTGEWEEAISIWKTLLSFYEKLPDVKSKTKKPASLLRIKVYTEYSRTLQLCGEFTKAEKILNKALTLALNSNHEHADWYQADLYLLFSELYFQQNEIEKAYHAIIESRRIKKSMESQQKETIDELKILKHEINVLLALNRAEEAREKLTAQYQNCKSNWDIATYYHLLGIIEKNEMNFGLAKNAFSSSLEKTREIGASSLTEELIYIDLLVEMARTGNQNAIKEVESLLIDFENKVQEKKLSAYILECHLLKAHLARFQSNYDQAYRIYSEIIRDADTYQLFRQKKKALEAINLIEQEGQQLRATKELSVYRYLEDARRILEENS